MDRVIQEQLEQIGQSLENQVDDQLAKFESLKVDDLQVIRDEIQKKRKLRMEAEKLWREMGHGSYDEIPDELEFFNAAKKSDRFVAHFYRESTERCKIVDLHMKSLAAQHLETRFVKIDAEKCPFLCGRLVIRVIPSILILYKNVVMDRIVGFTELGNRDDFKTDMLEWRLAQKCDVIDYEGDKNNPPDQAGPKPKQRTNIIRKSNLRRGGTNESDDEEEEEDSG